MPYCIFPRSFIHYTTKVSDRSVLFQTIITEPTKNAFTLSFLNPIYTVVYPKCRYINVDI